MFPVLRQQGKEPRQEQLLKLYWNRAGVKRELAGLKRERFELLDRIKEQEHAILRAQEQLEGLERLLVDPVAAANAMVYFQLRHMWRVAAQKIEQFAAEFAAKRERRERAQLHAEIIAKRNRRLGAVNEKLSDLVQKRKDVIESRHALETRLEHTGFLMGLFIGARLRRQIRKTQENQQVLDERMAELNELVEKIQGESLPESEGLGLESRRVVNLAVIALAQHLVMHFWQFDLATLAKSATERPVADMRFGDRRSCDQMVELIRERIADLNADRGLADAVRRRTDYLMSRVDYRHETDSIPRPESVALVHRVAELAAVNGAPSRRADDSPIVINVLADEYWDLYPSLR